MEKLVNPFELILSEISELRSEVRRLKNQEFTPTQSVQRNEGGINFALEILSEKAGVTSKPTVYKWTHEGRIPCEKRGKKLWFHRDQLEAWIEAGMPHNGLKQAAKRLAKLNA